MTNYATADDLRTFLSLGDEDPWPNAAADATVNRYLRLASGLVADTIQAAVYAVDQSGLPTLPAHLTAVRDATMTHADAWLESGVDPARGRVGLARRVKSKSASGGGLSVTYDADDPRLGTLADGRDLVPEAWSILWRAGLVSTSVYTASNPRDVYLVGTPYRLTTGELQP